MSKNASENLRDAIFYLKKTEDELLKFGMDMLSADDGKLFPVDLIAIGAMKLTTS